MSSYFAAGVLPVKEKEYFCSGKKAVLYNDKQEITTHKSSDGAVCIQQEGR